MGLKNIRIENFCFCCNLHIGTIIVAVLGWFLTTSSIFLYNDLVKFCDSYFGSIPRLLANIVSELLTFILCIMLILAVLKRNVKVIFVVIIFKTIEIFILTLVILVLLLSIIFTTKKIYIILYMVLACSILLIFAIYFWLCIWSLYLQYKEENSDIYENGYRSDDGNLNNVAMRHNC